MRKILPLLLAMLMLCGCGQDKSGETTANENGSPTFITTVATEPADPKPEEPQVYKSGDVQVLWCNYREQILPADYEVYVGRFPEKEGKVYVDLALQVRNTCDASINSQDISGYFNYDGKRYTMQFEVETNAGDFANTNKQVRPGETKIVHLFYTVDQQAEDSPITVHYTAFGESYEIAAGQRNEPEKKVLRVGEIFLKEGQYSLEVLDCLISSKLQATGIGGVKYYVEGSDIYYMTVKVRNLGYGDLNFVEGYLLAGEQPEFATVQVEVNNNTELVDWTGGIGCGETEIIHIWVAVPQDMPSAGIAMRLNVQNDSFCCFAIA